MSYICTSKWRHTGFYSVSFCFVFIMGQHSGDNRVFLVRHPPALFYRRNVIVIGPKASEWFALGPHSIWYSE